MRTMVAARIAARELRGGRTGVRIFVLCLMLGVAAIAAVGTLRAAIEAGLVREGAALLGGDAEMEFTYRFANDAERDWMDAHADQVSEIADFRSLAVARSGDDAQRGLTQVKAVDTAYPLAGSVVLDPPMPLTEALRGTNDTPGAVMHRALIDRMGLNIGDSFRLGTQEFVLSAELVLEPDAGSAGFSLGPRTIVYLDDLAQSGLLSPGTLFESKYRLNLPPDADLAALEMQAEGLFREGGLRWRDSRDGAPGIRDFVERTSAFLVLVGLAGLAVGGVGISASVRAYLDGKIATIATLKTLGAERGTIFAVYLMQIAVLTAVGITLGLVMGAGLPLLLSPVLEARLPVPAEFTVFPAPLIKAAVFGVLTAAIFALWPLARTDHIRPADLFRDAVNDRLVWPRPIFLGCLAALVATLAALVIFTSRTETLAAWTLISLAGAMLVLSLAAIGVRRAALWLSARSTLRGRPVLRTAFAAIAGPGEGAGPAMISLGLGLSVLAAVGQINANLRHAIEGELPDVAPSYFFVDIQPDQIDGYLQRVEGDPGVEKVETAPMLRGVITQINGRPATEVAGPHWVLRGDRGVTYSDVPPEDTVVTAGDWWPADYDGSPQISFAADEAAEMGLTLGDSLTINILGREITGEITSFREVDFSTAGIGFILSMNPSALRGAPHSFISTVYADQEAEAAILRDVADAYPNVTGIRVRDAIENVSGLLGGLATAISYGAGVTLLTGFVVLIGSALAGERSRTYEAAIMKTIGATRRQTLTSFALRSGVLGVCAGVLAFVAGSASAWAVITYIMDADYVLFLAPSVGIVLGGLLLTLGAGLAFAWRPLSARPARILRARE